MKVRLLSLASDDGVFSPSVRFSVSRMVLVMMWNLDPCKILGQNVCVVRGHLQKLGKLTGKVLPTERECSTHWCKTDKSVAAHTCLERFSRTERHESELRIKTAIERVVYLVCACWSANRGLWLKSRRHVILRLTIPSVDSLHKHGNTFVDGSVNKLHWNWMPVGDRKMLF